MANLNIIEFGMQGRDTANIIAPIAQLPALATQNVAIGGASAQSSALGANTGMIRLRSDVACAVLVGTNPTALITSLMLDANSPEYFAVAPNAALKIAVIAI